MKWLVRTGAVCLRSVRAVAANSVPPTAAMFLGLFDELQTAEAKGGKPHRAFQLMDTEINDYMRYALRTTPRLDER